MLQFNTQIFSQSYTFIPLAVNKSYFPIICLFILPVCMRFPLLCFQNQLRLLFLPLKGHEQLFPALESLHPEIFLQSHSCIYLCRIFAWSPSNSLLLLLHLWFLAVPARMISLKVSKMTISAINNCGNYLHVKIKIS